MITATAPGKIILFGEHAVVYNRPAIAVPVTDVQATVTIEPMETGSGLRLIAPDLGRDERLTVNLPTDPLAKIIDLTLHKLQQHKIPDATLHLTSTIPLGRGLGSGAAVSTAIVKALAGFCGRELSPAEISSLVYEVEKLYHGTPSGIDNTVISYSQPVYFIRNQPIQRMKVVRPLSLIIADTGIVAPTHQVVGDLRRRWQASPNHYEAIFDRVGELVYQARSIIERGSSSLSILGQLMDENQAMLVELGVSSAALDQLVLAARQAGALGAKLSGAGWGGNMIALAEPNTAARIPQYLANSGATGVIVTTVHKTE